jgi:integrase
MFSGLGASEMRALAWSCVAASLLIATSERPKTAQVGMGHASIKTTYDVYGHLWKELEDDYAPGRAVEALVFPA